MKPFYALIMAGGGGTRLWPLSRRDRPKQLLSLMDDRTMFQMAVDRLAPLIPPERVLVVAGRHLADALQGAAPEVPADRFIVEPFGQNNGPSVALALAHIQREDPSAVVGVLAADHYIADTARFRAVLAAAAEVAQDGYIVTLGVTPAYPATGYGYIKQDHPLTTVGEFPVYHVARFTEKPDLPTAMQFLAEGSYSWNSGMFIATARRLRAEYARQQPALYALMQRIEDAIGTPDYATTLDEVWPQMPRLSIDYAIMEGADRMAVIPVDMGWSDIGSWASLHGVLDGDGAGNIVRGDALLIDTSGTLVIGTRRVVTIGVEDLIIVDTPDALLICRRDRAEDVRQVVDVLKAAGEDHLL